MYSVLYVNAKPEPFGVWVHASLPQKILKVMVLGNQIWWYYNLIIEENLLHIKSLKLIVLIVDNHNYNSTSMLIVQVQHKEKNCNFTVNRDHSYKKLGNKGGHLHL